MLGIKLFNLWIFYVLTYVVAFPLRQLAVAKRGEPIEDPEMMAANKVLMVATLLSALRRAGDQPVRPAEFRRRVLYGADYLHHRPDHHCRCALCAGGETGAGQRRRLSQFTQSELCRHDHRDPRHDSDGLDRLAVEHRLPDLLRADHPLFPLDGSRGGSLSLGQVRRLLPRLSESSTARYFGAPGRK